MFFEFTDELPHVVQEDRIRVAAQHHPVQIHQTSDDRENTSLKGHSRVNPKFDGFHHLLSEADLRDSGSSKVLVEILKGLGKFPELLSLYFDIRHAVQRFGTRAVIILRKPSEKVEKPHSHLAPNFRDETSVDEHKSTIGKNDITGVQISINLRPEIH